MPENLSKGKLLDKAHIASTRIAETLEPAETSRIKKIKTKETILGKCANFRRKPAQKLRKIVRNQEATDQN